MIVQVQSVFVVTAYNSIMYEQIRQVFFLGVVKDKQEAISLILLVNMIF